MVFSESCYNVLMTFKNKNIREFTLVKFEFGVLLKDSATFVVSGMSFFIFSITLSLEKVPSFNVNGFFESKT